MTSIVEPPAAPPPRPPWSARLRAARAWLQARETTLWWLHSLYALAIGIGVMWLGSRNFAWLRVTFVYVAFIWLSSLVAPRLLVSRVVPVAWRRPLHLAVNYFNKNFYQQLLFFVLPVYWASVTPGARNMWFAVLVGVSAVLSTFDVVYDRHLSVKRPLTAVFFGFNLFACLNVTLPVIFAVSNAMAMRLSAAAAAFGFLTLLLRARHLRRPRMLGGVAAGALMLVMFVEVIRPFVPPAPLRVVAPAFGTSIRRQPPSVPAALSAIDAGYTGRLYVVTPIWAPLGLRDRVRHRWTVDGKALFTSPFYEVTGGRNQGYRLWSSAPAVGLPAGARVAVDIETEAGQLVGRAHLPVR